MSITQNVFNSSSLPTFQVSVGLFELEFRKGAQITCGWFLLRFFLYIISPLFCNFHVIYTLRKLHLLSCSSSCITDMIVFSQVCLFSWCCFTYLLPPLVFSKLKTRTSGLMDLRIILCCFVCKTTSPVMLCVWYYITSRGT